MKTREEMLVWLTCNLAQWPYPAQVSIPVLPEKEGNDWYEWNLKNGHFVVRSRDHTITQNDWNDRRVPAAMLPAAMLPAALQPGERVEALNDDEKYQECITVGPHPHGTGQFVFITEAGVTFLSGTFRPVKTECEVVVSAALEHLGYDVTEFKFDGTETEEVCASLVNLFKAGYLSEPKS